MKRRRVRMDKKFSRIAEFGADLKGLGGLQTSKVRGLKGATYGAANPGRRLSADERRAIEDQKRKDGKI